MDVRFLVRASALGPGVDTPTSLDQVISVMAIKMRRWIFVARVNAVSFIYQIARPAVSHLGACFSRAATRSRSMWSSIAVGWVS